ncbi:MAG: lysophospholipid acyltransferase family protein, partial [Pyrinomonadaceae bacterium]
MEIDKIYRFAPLSAYSLKDRLLIRIADLAFYALITVVGRTLKYEVDGWEYFEEIQSAGKQPIYAMWHDRLFSGTYFFRHRGIVVLNSQSFDGEYISRFIQRLGYGSVRGSSTRGGTVALVKMIRLMRAGLPMAFTLDGPKGPRYLVKNGAVLLAKKTGNPLVPFVLECKRFWTVKSWDKMQIPQLFSRVK